MSHIELSDCFAVDVVGLLEQANRFRIVRKVADKTPFFLGGLSFSKSGKKPGNLLCIN